MTARHALQLIVCALISAGTVAAVAGFDRTRAASAQKEYGLTVARQIASQADGIAFAARAEGREDAIGEAIRALAQGTDPRMIQIARIQGEPGAAVTQKDRFDPASGTTEYLKVLTPEDGAGVKVTVLQSPRGFLGARSQLEHDLTSGALFTILFLATLHCSGWLIRRKSRSERLDAAPEAFEMPAELKAELASRSSDAKATLVSLTAGLRDALKQTQFMSKATSKSLEHVALLHGRIHSGLEGLNRSKKSITEGEKAVSDIEVASLNVVMAANRLGAGGRSLTRAATDLHRKIQKMRVALQNSREAVQELEISLEPCVTDADLAFHSFDGFKEQAAELSQHVRKTTEAISAENRLINELRDLSERVRA